MLRLQQAAAGSATKLLMDMGEMAKDQEEASARGGDEPTLVDVHVASSQAAVGSVSHTIQSGEKQLTNTVTDRIDKARTHGAGDVNNDTSDSTVSGAGPSGGDAEQHGLMDDSLDSLEICPLAFATVEEIANNVRDHGGAALLIDYGENYPQVWGMFVMVIIISRTSI